MRNFKKALAWISVIAISAVAFYVVDFDSSSEKEYADKEYIEENKLGIPEVEMSPVETNAERAEYYFRLLRDPATNSIPVNIRSRELAFAKNLQARSRFKSSAAPQYVWQSVGPNDVGGRTRALGIDQRDPDIIIAGAVSGGIWKSIDGGTSWQMKSDLSQNMSVASLTQDPGNPDTWYYGSGEFSGNSAGARGFSARYYGTGIFKSVDNGESWSRISSTEDTDVSFSSRFDYVSRIRVSPTTGSIFAASNGFGLSRSTDGGSTFPLIRGGANEHTWTDFDIDANGNIIAIFSSASLGGNTSGTPGVFYSTDDGDTWTDVTPSGLTNDTRSVITLAPSDPDIVYIFSQRTDNANQGLSFFQLDITDPANPTFDNRSGNLPDFGGQVGGLDTQGGYDMVLQVKPDDPNFVLVGGTNLFRSTDGFASAPTGGYDNGNDSQKDQFWVGGYAKANNVSQYPANHPDQHTAIFDPTNNNRLWAGHDGAISVTEDITAGSVSWTDRDDGLITSQMYVVSMPDDEGDNRIGGGAQDNGTPFFTLDGSGNQVGASDDISSGDGSYLTVTENYVYASSQNGRVLRWKTSGTTFNNLDFIHPVAQGTAGQLFVHPFAIDPNDEDIMYYPAAPGGNAVVWRNTNTGAISNGSSTGTSGGQGWMSIDAGLPGGYTITTLEVSRAPADVLYYGATSNSGTPRIFKATSASSMFSVTDVSFSSPVFGAYVHDIAVNKGNGNELIAVLSNYNVDGIFYSADGGNSWTSIEGSLTGDSNNPGPSIRSAAIIPARSGTLYFVGTSTGLYSTNNLDGSNTQWTLEATNTLGFAVVENLDDRISDGDIAVGSHGQGIFLGDFQGSIGSPGPPATPQNLTIASNASQIILNWDDNTDVDFQDYRVYKGFAPNDLSLFETITNGSSNFSDAESSEIPVYYQISAVDNEGIESDLTDIVAAYRGESQLNDDWQLVGSPLSDNGNLVLPANFQLIGFDGAYQISSTVTPGQGYWIKPASASTINYDGNKAGSLIFSTISLNKGWNLIGGVTDTVAVSDIEDPGGILTATPVQRYTGGSYSATSTINPTEGYFIFVSDAGNITLEVDTTSSASKRAPIVQNKNQSSAKDYDRLQFVKNGFKQSIYLADNSLSGENKLYYLMPPLAPNPVIDVRTQDGYSIADRNRVGLQIVTRSYPVQVQLSPASTGSYRLIAIDEGNKIYFDLKPGKAVTLNKKYGRVQLEKLDGTQEVLTNSLSPNFPNPFNPSTTIKYQISQEAQVSLEVYNIVGKKVRTLVNQVQQPGTYTETFNATNLSSGTYFMRIRAGTFTEIQKMTLIK